MPPERVKGVEDGLRNFNAAAHSPVYFMGVVVGSIVAADLFVLSGLHAFPGLTVTTEILLGTFLVAVISTPLLYYLAFRPLTFEIQARRRMEEELKRLAMTDSLTRINNREKFYEVIEREVERWKRHGTPLSLLMFDVDEFKQINDARGHNAGDEVLKTLTMLVGGHLREIDYFIRWGGDEFLIIAPDTGIDSAAALADRLRGYIESHLFEAGSNITVSFSVAQFKRNETVDGFIQRADAGLYRAKSTGRNRVERCG